METQIRELKALVLREEQRADELEVLMGSKNQELDTLKDTNLDLHDTISTCLLGMNTK
jgi:hypothetical protein